MNQPSPYGAHQRRSASEGVPIAYALIGAAVTLLVGIYLGKTSSAPAPDPVPSDAAAASNSAAGALTKFDPRMAAQLEECKTEKKNLLVALTSDKRDDGPEDDDLREDDRRESSRGSRSSSGRRRSPTERRGSETADVKVWQATAKLLGNGPHIQVDGKVNNRESKIVEGVLRVTLISAGGEPVDEAVIPMMLEPGLSAWQHVFRWAPDGKYRAKAEWQTLVL